MIARFAAKFEVRGGCWVWTATTAPEGYGQFWWNGRLVGAHRASWEMHHGPIPNGLHVLHSCDNPPCVNPAHLFLGTPGDNTRDMLNKGRGVARGQPGERHPEAKLNDAAVIEIRTTTTPGRELAARFGVSESAVSLVRCGKSWRHVEVGQ